MEPKKFEDEYELDHEIKNCLIKEKNQRIFSFIYKWFNNHDNKFITTNDLCVGLRIPSIQLAYQKLSNFYFLELLIKVRKEGFKQTRFYPTDKLKNYAEFYKEGNNGVDK